MFDYQFKAELKNVEVQPLDDGPAVKRIVKVKVRCDFDTLIARAVAGDYGIESLQALRDLTTTKVEFPIDAITAKGTLIGGTGSRVEIERITGIKAAATAKKPKEPKPDADGNVKEPETPAPEVTLQFSFEYTDEIWIFLGRNSGAYIDLTLAKNQLAFDYKTPEPPDPSPQGKLFSNGLTAEQKAKLDEVGKQIGEAIGRTGDEVAAGLIAKHALPSNVVPIRPSEDDDRDVNQVAETPEEAEELRAARLAAEEPPEPDSQPVVDDEQPSETPTDEDEGLAF